MAVRAMESARVALSTWTVLDDDSDRVRCIVSAESRGYAVRTEDGHELGRFPSIREALDALPRLCA